MYLYWYCYITVDSATTALQHNNDMKSLEIYFLEKKTFYNIILTQKTIHGILPKLIERGIYYKQQLRNNAIL